MDSPVLQQHCLICRSSYSTVLEDAWIEPRKVATLALAVTEALTTRQDLTCNKRTGVPGEATLPQVVGRHHHGADANSRCDLTYCTYNLLKMCRYTHSPLGLRNGGEGSLTGNKRTGVPGKATLPQVVGGHHHGADVNSRCDLTYCTYNLLKMCRYTHSPLGLRNGGGGGGRTQNTKKRNGVPGEATLPQVVGGHHHGADANSRCDLTYCTQCCGSGMFIPDPGS